jgi:hypothetical protein
MRNQFDQCGLFASRRVLQQFDQVGCLPRRQWQRWDAQRGALGNMGSVSLQHGFLLV